MKSRVEVLAKNAPKSAPANTTQSYRRLELRMGGKVSKDSSS